ncbi:hypothetical protein ACLBXI_06825 [Bacillus cereus]
MKIRGQEWRDMEPEQKRKLIRQKVVEKRNKFAEKQWESLVLKDKQTFWQCTNAPRHVVCLIKFWRNHNKQVK